MVTKSFLCPNGHRWDGDHDTRCPICGTAAGETIGNADPQHESTHASEAGSDRVTSVTTAEHSKFGRYQILDELGRGGMGIVYRAFDPVQQCEVALKTIPNTDPESLSRFKREFRLLAEVDHPNVVKLFELNSDGETWFFTMEILAGVDLLSFVEHGGSAPANSSSRNVDESDPALTQAFVPFARSAEKVQRLQDCAAQLAGAIAALHDRGVVHRDIKPSNVMVTADRRVVLLDFGLVAQTDASGIYQSVRQGVLGTAAYMSPEQAASEPVSTASDWYSLGVMLYQALTGKLPFSGKAIDILFKKQKQRPPPPSAIDPTISRDWNDLCTVLLCRNPENRPAGDEILQRLGVRQSTSNLKQAVDPDEVALVGREIQFQQLHEAWRTVRGGEPKCVFVAGRSGTGKSSLVEAFLDQLARDGAAVLKSRCYEMESVPFKAIDSLIDSLVNHLARLPPPDAAALMPRDVHALARVFPVIAQVKAVADLPQRPIDVSDQQELNRRAIGALRELLTRMGDRYPLVVYIDDLQWGDEDSATMLTDLLQQPEAPVLLFLGTYRSEDVETSQFLQALRELQRQRETPLDSDQIEVLPLEQADAVKLASALLGRDDSDALTIAESIAREASGNPFFVSELVRHFQLKGEHVSAPTEGMGLFDMIWSRVRGLPDESQRLLAVVALWGQPLPLDQAMRIAGVGQSSVGPLRTGHLIRTVGASSASRIETYHDRVRESISLRLDRETKQRFHLRIAEEYTRQFAAGPGDILDRLDAFLADGSAQIDDFIEVGPQWYEAAFHFDAAGRSDLAFPYALASAEKSRKQFSLEVAEKQYRIAQRDADSRGHAVRYRIAEGLGDVLMLRGHYDDLTAKMFQAASRLASDNFTRAQIEGKLGILAFKEGDNATSCEALERSLRLLGQRVPTRTGRVMLCLVRELFVQTLHTIVPQLLVARRSLSGAESELLAADLHVHLARAYFFERGKIPSLWTQLRAMNLAEKYPTTPELGFAWASHAPVMSLIPWFSRGEAYGKKSLEIRQQFGDVCGQGQSFHYIGVVLFAWAKFDGCISACREAVRLCERSGDFWERNMAWWQSANAVYRKGELVRAITECRRLYEVCVKMGDDKVSGFALDVWSRASGGLVPAEITQREMQKERNDVWAQVLVLLAEALRLIRHDKLEQAAAILNQAYDQCRGGGMNAWVGPILPWLATTYRMQSEQSADEAHRRQLFNSARKTARLAVSVARKFQTDLPHALREAGLASAMQGSERRARKYLDESLAVAQRQGARFEQAQTSLARGVVGRKFAWPAAADEVDSARKALQALDADFALTFYPDPEEL